MHLVFALLATVISLFPRNNHAEEDAREQSKALEVGVVLEAGDIDSSTVEVGAFAIVIHGQGERQPVSGEWESLSTARGYIQAVNVESLTLVLEGDYRADQIALNRIQTLALIGSHPAKKEQPSSPRWANRENASGDGEIEAAGRVGNADAVDNRGEERFHSLTDSVHDASGFQAVPDTLSVRTARMEDGGVGKRIVKKLGVGALMVVPVYGLGLFLESALYGDSEGGDGLGAGIFFEFTPMLHKSAQDVR